MAGYWLQSFSLAGWRLLETDGGVGCPTMWMYLIPLNCTLKNGEDGKFYVLYIWPQLKFFNVKKSTKDTGEINLVYFNPML